MAKRRRHRVSTNSRGRAKIDAVSLPFGDDDLPERSKLAIEESRALLERSKAIIQQSRRLVGNT